MFISDLLDELPATNNDIIPIAVHQLLKQPLNVSNDWQKAEQLLLQAKQLMPEQLELSIALYKMYAYSKRYEQALALIKEVLEKSSRLGGFSSDFLELNPQSSNWTNIAGPERLYLYSLKALGFVYLRQAKIKSAQQVLKKLLELDSRDLVGGSVVFDMANALAGEEN